MSGPGTDWMNRAACRSYVNPPGKPWPWDTEVLTGRGAKRRMRERDARAKAVCAACPVREQCLEYGILQAIDNEIVDGVWGGKNPAEIAELMEVPLRFSSGILRFASLCV